MHVCARLVPIIVQHLPLWKIANGLINREATVGAACTKCGGVSRRACSVGGLG